MFVSLKRIESSIRVVRDGVDALVEPNQAGGIGCSQGVAPPFRNSPRDGLQLREAFIEWGDSRLTQCVNDAEPGAIPVEPRLCKNGI